MGAKRIHTVRTRGGNTKFRALRLDTGNFSWGSEAITRKTRLIDVVYNASNNELVRTKTLVKGAIVQIDATPFRQWWESHYGLVLGKKKVAAEGAAAEEQQPATPAAADKKVSSHVRRKQATRKSLSAVESHIEEQFSTGRLYGTFCSKIIYYYNLIKIARIASRPGQSGRCDGYVLEGKELDFYLRKLRSKKHQHA
jgi:small subunit ribosomal protein S8e